MVQAVGLVVLEGVLQPLVSGRARRGGRRREERGGEGVEAAVT